MKTVALTLASFITTARKIAGPEAEVTTVWETMQRIEAIDLLLVFLHPNGDGQAWLNDERQIVVTRDQLAAAQNLHGAAVFVGACYGLENDAMLMALEHAGARAIVAGPGVNVGGLSGYLAGADVMAGALRSALQLGSSIGAAWTIARAIVHAAKWRGVSGAEDALGYRLHELSEGESKAKGKSKMAAIITGIVGVLLMLLSALSGGPGATTAFVSILSPLAPPAPGNQVEWARELYVNGEERDIFSTIYVTSTDVITVTDYITHSGAVTSTLQWLERYEFSKMDLASYGAPDGGSFTPSLGQLQWDHIGDNASYRITRTFTLAGTWETAIIEDDLFASSGVWETVYMNFVNGTYEPPPTPTPTSTPTPTLTPTATPTSTPTPEPTTRYVLTAIPFGTATPRPTVLCCQTTPGASVSYRSLLPLILLGYPLPTPTPAPP
jgi:hypothetical protein